MTGIGITTRNRARILDIALKHFEAFADLQNCKLFVYNDTDDEAEKAKYLPVAEKYKFTEFQSGEKRLGIAKAKNECIKALEGCEHLFLFDDDCFPKKEEWEALYIDTATKCNMHHLMHLQPFSIIQPIQSDEHVTEYSNCLGTMLYFTRHAIDVLGGYDPRFDCYGFEHAQISNRAQLAGLTGTHSAYSTPARTEDFIYTLDIDWNSRGMNPPLIDMHGIFFNSSLIGDEGKVDSFVATNNQFLDCQQIRMVI